MAFPCPDDCFAMPDPVSFMAMVTSYYPEYKRLQNFTVRDALHFITHDEEHEDHTINAMPALTNLDLFILIKSVSISYSLTKSA